MTHILVIEDDKNILGAVADVLELAGYETASAADGLAGLEHARSRRPDLVICDIAMPYLDGYGVLQQLRQDADLTTTPFVFLTARTAKTDMRMGMALGADDYLTKPFTEEELLQVVETRLLRQLRLTNALQSRMDLLRQDIARTLPHELRTPLHGIIAGADFLRGEYQSLTPDEVQEMAEIIYQSAERLERLVQNHILYLELALAAPDSIATNTGRAASLASVAEVVETSARREAAAAGREEELLLDLQPALVPVDQVHLSKIVAELVGNAFKFSSPGAPVRIAVHTGGSAVIRVTDHGRGMSPDEIAAIGAYTQFHRAHYEQQGAGLGLVIVKLLVTRYGGKLAIESKPGQQTTVCVTLPCA
jgi:signal transduction histidine kinase